MPKRNDGNEQDLRVRPSLDAKSLEGDNPYDGNDCETYGEQIDFDPVTGLPVDPDCGEATPPVDAEDINLFDWQDTSEVCPTGYSPLQVDKLYMRILKNHFSSSERIFDSRLTEYVYSDDPEVSKIRIVMNTSFDPAQPDILPALVIKRGVQTMQRAVFGDLGESGELLQGTPHYVRFVHGGHRVLCMGASDGFSEALAFEVFNLLNYLSPNIRRDLPMHDFQVKELSELGLIDNLGNTLGVAVESTYIYEYGWTLKEIAPTLHVARAVSDVQLEQVNLEQSNVTLRTC